MRKYEVTLPNGKVVSRQRAHQLKHQERYKAMTKRYRESEAGRKKIAERQAVWREEYLAKHGMTYAQAYAKRKREERQSSKED